MKSATKKLYMKSFKIHNHYNFPTHDVAIITTNGIFEYSNEVGPVCLPNILDQELLNNEKILGMGWGRTKTSSFSNVLKENLFTIISDKACRKFYAQNLDSSIMCTRDDPGESICQGDSGSAVGKIENDRFTLYGIVSFTGIDCSKGSPTGFTQILPHLDWIMSHIDMDSQ